MGFSSSASTSAHSGTRVCRRARPSSPGAGARQGVRIGRREKVHVHHHRRIQKKSRELAGTGAFRFKNTRQACQGRCHHQLVLTDPPADTVCLLECAGDVIILLSARVECTGSSCDWREDFAPHERLKPVLLVRPQTDTWKHRAGPDECPRAVSAEISIHTSSDVLPQERRCIRTNTC